MQNAFTIKPSVRMFVDENGHQTLKGDLANNNNRFLCLSGIIMPLTGHYDLGLALDDLKLKHFGAKEIILHRRELVSAKPPFEALLDPDARKRFDDDFLKIVNNTKYYVISVAIDKKALVDKYGILHARDPYALALEFLLQRYLYWLQEWHSKYEKTYGHIYGDVMAEARGKGEDRITKQTYIEIYNGRGYNPLHDVHDFFSSKEITLKPKSANIAGLQFVDLLAHPARRYILMKNDLAPDIKSSSYEQKIVDILVESKFRRDEKDIIEGTGTILFPKK